MFVARLGGPRNAPADVIEGVVGQSVAVIVGVRGAVTGSRGDARGRGLSGVGRRAGGRVRLTGKAPAVLDRIARWGKRIDDTPPKGSPSVAAGSAPGAGLVPALSRSLVVGPTPEEPPIPSIGSSANGRCLPEQAASVMSMAKLQPWRAFMVVPS
jgi:hypothetical protein